MFVFDVVVVMLDCHDSSAGPLLHINPTRTRCCMQASVLLLLPAANQPTKLLGMKGRDGKQLPEAEPSLVVMTVAVTVCIYFPPRCLAQPFPQSACFIQGSPPGAAEPMRWLLVPPGRSAAFSGKSATRQLVLLLLSGGAASCTSW
jgi:hypothetical protein